MLSISSIDFAYASPHTPVLRQWSAEFPGGVSVVSGDDGSCIIFVVPIAHVWFPRLLTLLQNLKS